MKENDLVFLRVNDTSTDPSNKFYRIASFLMNDSMIQIGQFEARIAELEFYLFHSHHQDVSVHCDELQLHFGKWYLHRSKKSRTIKTGNRKGIDITFGSLEEGIYGGILIRAIEIPSTGSYIYGPSKVVDEIMIFSGINDLNEIQGTSITNNKTLAIIFKNLRIEQVFSGIRYGLTNETNPYHHKFYRFYIYPKQKHAGKETLLIPSLQKQGVSQEKILEIFGRKSMPSML